MRTRAMTPVLWLTAACDAPGAGIAWGGATRRAGCACLNSCLGVCPNSWIWASSAARCTGSLTASMSTAPSYVMGWNTLSRATAASPRWATPKMRSIHRCRRPLTGGASSAARMQLTKWAGP